MKPIIRLDLKPKQRLFLSPTFKQALKILSLPILELKELIEKELNSNPLLEKIDHPAAFTLPRPKTFAKEELLARLPYQPSLYESLIEQAQIILSASDLPIATFLIGSLNEKGFLDEDLKEIAHSLKVSETTVLDVLKKIQTFDPPGIGARNLQESLLLQLKEKNKENNLSYTIIKDHFSNFLKNQKKELSHKLGITVSELTKIIMQDLKNLNYNPADTFQSFSGKENKLLIPDLTIEYEKGHFLIFLNKDRLPSVKVNRYYLSLLANSSDHHSNGSLLKEEKKILKRYFFSAQTLLKNLQRREELFKQLALLLIKNQRGYLLGLERLIPFSLKELALKLNLSLSSAYRLIADKYLLSPRGLEPLKNLFSLPVKDSAISKKSATDLLKKMISEEDKNCPFSDQALMEKLSSLGVCWKRRTVAKYRQKLKIAPAHLRKTCL